MMYMGPASSSSMAAMPAEHVTSWQQHCACGLRRLSQQLQHGSNACMAAPAQHSMAWQHVHVSKGGPASSFSIAVMSAWQGAAWHSTSSGTAHPHNLGQLQDSNSSSSEVALPASNDGLLVSSMHCRVARAKWSLLCAYHPPLHPAIPSSLWRGCLLTASAASLFPMMHVLSGLEMLSVRLPIKWSASSPQHTPCASPA
jgi:hypothetical protein